MQIRKNLTTKSFYTCMFGPDLPMLQTRITGAKLETFETHSYLQPYTEIIYLNGYQKIKKPSHLKLPAPDWSTRFYIDYNSGLMHSPNYCFGSFSSKFTLDFVSDKNFLIYPETFSPDLLYAIPQAAWDDFITQLPFQNIAIELNLSTHRHLWPAYNYSASASSYKLQIWRTFAFSKYHFLSSLLDPVIEKNCFYNQYQPLKKLIDEDELTKEKMLDYSKIHFGSFVTPTYLDRLSYCPLITDFISIGKNFLAPKASSILDETILNTDKLNKLIHSLPSSKHNMVNFEKMISDVNVIGTPPLAVLSDNLKSRILYHARNNYGLFKTKNLQNYSKCFYYLKAIFDDLVFPATMRKFFEMTNWEYETYDANSSNAIELLYTHSLNIFMKIMHEYLSIDKLMKLSDKWHLKRVGINSKKPAPMIQLVWHAFFAPQIINQVEFTCITNEAEARKEGEEMENCAGGMGVACVTGTSHLIRAQTVSGERSSVWIEFNLLDKNYMIAENLACGKKVACKEILDAAEILLDKINKKQIVLNPLRGEVAHLSKKTDDISYRYPYPLNKIEIQESIYQAYLKEVLPSFMLAATYPKMIEKFSEKMDLAECIKSELPNCEVNPVKRI